MYSKNKLKFSGEFRVRRIKNIIEVEYGEENKQKCEIGRVCVINYSGKKEQQFMYEGELKQRPDGLHSIDGYGRYIYQGQCAIGQFHDHNIHGFAKVIKSDGTIREGQYQENVMHGQGKVTQDDGTILQGKFVKGKL